MPTWVELVTRTLQWVGGAGLAARAVDVPHGSVRPALDGLAGADLGPLPVRREPPSQHRSLPRRDQRQPVQRHGRRPRSSPRYTAIAPPLTRSSVSRPNGWSYSVATGLALFIVLILGVELDSRPPGRDGGVNNRRRDAGRRLAGDNPCLDGPGDPAVPAVGHRSDSPPHRHLRRGHRALGGGLPDRCARATCAHRLGE